MTACVKDIGRRLAYDILHTGNRGPRGLIYGFFGFWLDVRRADWLPDCILARGKRAAASGARHGWWTGLGHLTGNRAVVAGLSASGIIARGAVAWADSGDGPCRVTA